MKFSNDRLTLWYGTEDAPAPASLEIKTQPVSITIGVYPASPNNRVIVRYRVDGGMVKDITGILIKSDATQQTQYFLASWPNPILGETIEYVAILTCAGRQTPDIQTANTFPSSFRLSKPEVNSSAKFKHKHNTTTATKESQQFNQKIDVKLDFICTVRVEMSRPPEIIGETPEGLKVNWFVQTGEVCGPKLNASICPKGGDWMTIRPDGVGIMGVRATLKTYEGALIYATYSGVFDLGEEGYRNFLNNQWPETPQVRSTPRFLTANEKYKWLNRLQCVGIGEVKMSKLLMIYDLYAL